LTLKALKSLNLYNNKIGDTGARGLVEGTLGALTSLNLAGNNISAEGARCLKHGKLKVLSLDLKWNCSGEEEGKADLEMISPLRDHPKVWWI
jgi:hypothetical protein